MKRRGWRVALTVATAGLALVAGLVALNWPTVRDHADAWWFQATRETETFEPDEAGYLRRPDARPALLLLALTEGSLSAPVIADPDALIRSQTEPWRLLPNASSPTGVSTEIGLMRLRESGYRVIEQRLPRRAYVVVGYPDPPNDAIIGEVLDIRPSVSPGHSADDDSGF